jgi:hypothetical protein
VKYCIPAIACHFGQNDDLLELIDIPALAFLRVAYLNLLTRRQSTTMSSSYPYGVPNDTKTTGMPPAYLENIPMTSPRRLHPDVYDEAMPYRPREEAMPYRPQERSMEKAFRQLCCGSCWGFCAWIAGIVLILAGIIVVAVVLVSVRATSL